MDGTVGLSCLNETGEKPGRGAAQVLGGKHDARALINLTDGEIVG